MRDKITLDKIDKLILKDLFYSKKGLTAYTFWVRHKILPYQLVNSLEKLERKGLVKTYEMRIYLTDEGNLFSIGNSNLLEYEGDKHWLECPDDVKQEQMEINEPYIPNRVILSKELK